MTVSWLGEWKIKGMDCELSECMLIQPKCICPWCHLPLIPFTQGPFALLKLFQYRINVVYFCRNSIKNVRKSYIGSKARIYKNKYNLSFTCKKLL